jgi:hypothetical protein
LNSQPLVAALAAEKAIITMAAVAAIIGIVRNAQEFIIMEQRFIGTIVWLPEQDEKELIIFG